MPLSHNASIRAAAATRVVERMMRNQPGHRGRWTGRGGQSDKWVELKDALAPGGHATAHPRDWDGSAWVTDTTASREIEVYDEIGTCRGRGKGTYSSPHDAGSIARVRLNTQSSRWEIVDLQPNALLITGLATAAVASTDSTFTIDGVTVMNPSGGLICDTDPAAAITVYNVHSWDADDDARVEAAWNETTDHWEALQVTCPA